MTDHGLTVGDGVFEAVKVLDGRPFALTRHLERLTRSAAGLGLPEPRPSTRCVAASTPCSRVRPAARQAADHLHRRPRAARLRPRRRAPTLWWSSTRRSTPPPDDRRPSSVPWPRNERGALAGLKTTSYAENVVALAYAQERGGTEAVFANTRRQPLRGHRVQRLLRRRRRARARRRWPRAAWPASPGRCCSSGTARARWTSRSRCSTTPTRSSSSRRPGTCRPCTRVRRPRAAGAGPVTAPGPEDLWAARAAREHRPLSVAATASRARRKVVLGLPRSREAPRGLRLRRPRR